MQEKEDEDKTSEDSVEDELNILMEQVGLEGKFQTRFNYLYNMALILTVAMASMNIILALTTPEHWCHVPGRNETNLTLQEWKQLTIPRAEDESSGEEFSKCKMYNLSHPIIDTSTRTTNDTVRCTHGWDYDTTWYTMTIPSQEDWVCDKDMNVPNTFSFAKIGEVLGTIVVAQMGDIIGRRPVLFFGIAALVLGRCISMITTSYFFIFTIANMVAGLQMGVVFQAPLIIGMEISSVRLRAQIALLQCFGWTGGICIMPLIAWATGGDWMIFTLITTLPCAVVFLVYKTFPESPRWLAMKGKTRKCVKVLSQMARENGTTVPDNALEVLEKLKGKQEKVYGMASLCANKQLFKNTVLICTSLSVVMLSSFTIILTIANMSGNPFLNMFLQSLVELPGYLVGKVLCDRYGRRWSQAAAYLMSTAFQILCIFVVQSQDLLWLLIVLVLVVKFSLTVAAYCAYLMCMEVYPTCLRQTGTSVGVLVSMGVGSLGPYIVYLGTTVDMRFPYGILGTLCLLGILCALMLPETLNQRLPETLQDSEHFGKDHKIWSFPSRRKQNRASSIT